MISERRTLRASPTGAVRWLAVSRQCVAYFLGMLVTGWCLVEEQPPPVAEGLVGRRVVQIWAW